uniref:Protein kinase domain-containing protein n=1 Tax=Hyaloperonospora arabidopsidis (strain Emoy2) TaxID=559515 RepID=M4B1G0_HYAAE
MHGVCSSPLSSIDGEEDAASAIGFVPSPETKQSTRRSAGKKSRAKARKTIVPSRKRRKPTAAGTKSTQTLVQAAPRDFVAYLVEQLSAEQQIKYATEFGTTQDALVQLPAVEQWPNKRQRVALSRWLRVLGFVSSATLKDNVFCVDKTVADSVRAALMKDASVASGSSDAHDGAVFGSDGCSLGNGGAHQREKCESDAEMVRLQKHYEKMEAMTVEILSFSENRMLSSLHHEVIADAMESVLARSSVRRDRRLARRRSMLGRTSARRLSIGLASPCSTLQPLVADRIRDREKIDMRMSLTPVKCRVSPGDRGLTEKKTLQGERVLCLILYSGLIDMKSFKEVLRKVSIRAYAWIIADYSKRHPRGHYHASGAYKEVYKVFSSEQNRLEAISMMDISALEVIGNQSVICQEVAHSVLLSHATGDGICPNFLRVYDVFLAPDQPRPDLWGNRAHRKPNVARGDDVDTLCHTLYRFTVLFGLPGQNPSESKGIDKVWQLLLTHLRPEDPALTRLQRRSRRTKGVYEAQVLAKSQFDKDKSLYSIASGTNDIIRRCREGLQSVPGAMELLNKLVDFDPVKRPTLKQVMYHPVFSGYRLCDDATPPDYVISYYKNRHQGGHMIPDV